MSIITYAAAAWRGFASPAKINYIQIFVNKVKSIVTENININDVLNVINYNLFFVNPNTVIIVYTIYSLLFVKHIIAWSYAVEDISLNC